MKLLIALVFIVGVVTSEIWEGKKYVNYESKNFDEALKELGVNWLLRSLAAIAKPTISMIKLPNNKYKLVTESSVKSNEIVFELGKKFNEETLDSRKVKSVMTLEGNTFTQKQGGKPPVTIIREFGDKEMVATMRVNDIVCIRKYRAE